MTRIKVCGITNLDDAQRAVELGVDSLGFIFAESSRQVTLEEAQQIIDQLPPYVNLTGVFVDENLKQVKKIACECKLDTLQLHGDESAEYCQQLTQWRIVKSFAVKDKLDVVKLANYDVSAYLLDTYHPDQRGGTGKTFNWELAKQAQELGPVILAGGLTPDNITTAINQVQPYAVDVNSGVEIRPGIKDQAALRRLVKEIRGSRYVK
ncbi:MAG: phosphoribosylanthranilate isomerase [Bacillota bacterium]